MKGSHVLAVQVLDEIVQRLRLAISILIALSATPGSDFTAMANRMARRTGTSQTRTSAGATAQSGECLSTFATTIDVHRAVLWISATSFPGSVNLDIDATIGLQAVHECLAVLHVVALT